MDRLRSALSALCSLALAGPVLAQPQAAERLAQRQHSPLSLARARLVAQSQPSAIELLLRNARYWQARGREDKAAEAYEKVLRSDPREVEALSALGAQAARLGNAELAHGYLVRLKQIAPDSPDARMVERAISIGGEFDRLLAQARAYAKDGKVDEAVTTYRKLFGEGQPPRHLALEFYSTLGGSKDGWKEAKDGLEDLVKRNPSEPVYRLALGRIQTYREETRRTGVQALQKLVDEGQLVDEADPPLRQALLWLRLSTSDEPALRSYLARHPDDLDIKKRLAEPHPDLQRAGTVAAGYEALERSDVKEADRLFKSASRADQSADTLVGQGIVAMKEHEFAKARDIFSKVKGLVPAKPDMWDRSLRSATFWALMQDGRAAQTAGRSAEAESLFTQAVQSGADEIAFAEIALAELSLAGGQPEKAELRLRALLREKPDMPEALRGLLEVLIRTDQPEEAQTTDEHLAKVAPDVAIAKERLEAELLRFRAAAAIARGRHDLALQALTGARAADAKDAWVLHDLANLELQMGEPAAAREIATELLKLDPGMPEARVTWVRILADEGNDDGALAALAQLPPEAMNGEVRLLKPLLEVRAEAARIIRRASRERRDLVRDDLLRLQQKTHGQPAAASAVARAWVALGDAQRAVDLMNETVASNPDAPAGLKLDLAAVLLRAGQDAPLLALLAELSADPRLSPRERKGLTDLKVAVTVRRADRLREEGDLQQSFNTLAGPLNDLPDQPRLLCALGRLFLDGDRPNDAMAIFQRILAGDADDLEAREGAVRGAATLRNISLARRLVEEGLQRAPHDARMRLLAARLDVQLGEDGDAMANLEEARQLAANKLPTESTARGAPLTVDSSVADILSEGRKSFGAEEKSNQQAADAIQVEDDIEKEIADIRARHAAYLQGTLDLRARAGESGFSQLTAVRTPFEAGLPLGYRGRVILSVIPTLLDAGAVNFGDPTIAYRFGSGQLPAGDRPDLEVGMRQVGTELRVGYQQDGLAIDVGSSPLGFPLKTITGGLHFRHQISGFGFAIDVSRRLVEDSLLSMAGVTDPLSGTVWGQVTRNGGRLDLGYTTRSTTYYLWGGYDVLLGTGVARNTEVAGGLGMEWSVLESTLADFGTGLALTALGYQNNLSYFTLGQGGYFSPAGFLNASMPFRVHGANGKLKWQVQVNPGLNWFAVDRSPYFPNNAALQSARETQIDAMGDALDAFYPSMTSTAFAFDAIADLTYLVAEHLEGGAFLRVHHADDYDEVQGGIFLRLNFLGRDAQNPSASSLVHNPWFSTPER